MITRVQSREKSRRAVFLDRDGTIIRQVNLLHRRADLRLLPGAAAAIHALNEMGYLVVVVTNQPVVARGLATEKIIDAVHAVLQQRLQEHGARLDAIYVCPHHPDAQIKKYRVKCRCRKPEVGLITKAAREHHIGLSKSFMVGDSTRDTLAGNRAKLATILVQTGEGGKDVWQFAGKPDYVARNLADAVRYIKTHPQS